jgi:RNA polymerase sigma factor (sigma-70 family)
MSPPPFSKDGDPAGNPGRTDCILQEAIDRLRAGDAAAKDTLLAHASRQLRRMASKLLRSGPFQKIRRWEQTDDILQGSLVRLSKTLDREPVNDVRHFFALAATNIRWELQALRERLFATKRHAAHHRSDVGIDPHTGRQIVGKAINDAAAAEDPVARFERLLDEIECIPADDREILDLMFVHRLTVAEAAAVMKMTLATFKRRYRDAKCRVGKALEEKSPPKTGGRGDEHSDVR